jgi:hypothetical protein
MAIETATEEDTEMARTRKTDETTENVVPLRPEVEEQPQIDDQAEELGQPDSDQQAEAEGPSQSRSRGPALNRVELIGRIAKGPDLRVTHTGMHLVYFRVATNGRDERDTEFHQCTAFGKTAEFIGEYLFGSGTPLCPPAIESLVKTSAWIATPRPSVATARLTPRVLAEGSPTRRPTRTVPSMPNNSTTGNGSPTFAAGLDRLEVGLLVGISRLVRGRIDCGCAGSLPARPRGQLFDARTHGRPPTRER